MFCSIKVGLKDSNATSNAPPGLNKPRTDWEREVESVSAQWAKDRQRIVTPRNVGGTPKKRWTPEEDSLLAETVQKLGTENWKAVAAVITGRTGKQCRERYLGHISDNFVRHDWEPREDMILVEKQKEFGNRWSHISVFLPGRSAMSIKNRWNWLLRRNIPNHRAEFTSFVRSHINDKNATAGFESWEMDMMSDLFSPDCLELSLLD